MSVISDPTWQDQLNDWARGFAEEAERQLPGLCRQQTLMSPSATYVAWHLPDDRRLCVRWAGRDAVPTEVQIEGPDGPLVSVKISDLDHPPRAPAAPDPDTALLLAALRWLMDWDWQDRTCRAAAG
jgi:hypothetical protein